MRLKEKPSAASRAYDEAIELIDREWLAEGATKADLAQDEQLAQLFDRLVGSGRSVEDIRAEWESKTVKEILHGSYDDTRAG